MMFPRLACAIRDVVKSTWLKENLLALPRIAKLIPKLMSDQRVPARTKAALTGLAIYLVSPWDIIPDFIPGIGQLDDAIVLLLFIDGVLNQIDDAVLLDHWTGVDMISRKLLKSSSRQHSSFGRAANNLSFCISISWLLASQASQNSLFISLTHKSCPYNPFG